MNCYLFDQYYNNPSVPHSLEGEMISRRIFIKFVSSSVFLLVKFITSASRVAKNG